MGEREHGRAYSCRHRPRSRNDGIARGALCLEPENGRPTMKKIAILAAAALLVASAASYARNHQHGAHSTHGTSDVKGNRGPSSLAFHDANLKMHKAMDIAFTGNADVDFVKGMIPHHEGAVDMARVVLKYGKDAEIRRLAEAIIKAQETEITQMKGWLAKNAR